MGRNNRRLVVFPGEAGLILSLFLWVFNENIFGKMIGYSLVGKLKRTLRSYGLTFALLILKYQFSKQFSHTLLTIQVQRIRGLIVQYPKVEIFISSHDSFSRKHTFWEKGLSGHSGGLKDQREIHSNWMKDERLWNCNFQKKSSLGGLAA